jgi:hypothetical protein
MNNENNLEWYNCSIIFARALSLFLKEGESLVINNPAESDNSEGKKIIITHKNGLIDINPTDRNDIKEGDIFL